ncbi:MAG: hypothetical protein U0797_04290 [Gemmataceae bacterium]
MLRPASRANPAHFRLAANLGTAWQQAGDLSQAAAALEQAARLAPGKHARAEQLHLRLVRQRSSSRPGTQGLDDLFGVRFVGPKGEYQVGGLTPDQRKALPAAAAALAQQLALWLPADGRLLWQLAELANARRRRHRRRHPRRLRHRVRPALAETCKTTASGCAPPPSRPRRRSTRATPACSSRGRRGRS